MGRFTDKIKRILNGQPQKVKTLKELGHDAYFIRLTDKENIYIHFGGTQKDNLAYVAKEGELGACIFKLKNALNFIQQSGKDNLEAIRVDVVLKSEES